MSDDHQPEGAGGSSCPLAAKRAKQAEYLRRYNAKLEAAGLCKTGCGRPREGGSRCRPCKIKKQAENAERTSRSGCCNRCGKAWIGETKQCPNCLELKQKRDRKILSTVGGRWLNKTVLATYYVAKGKNGKNKFLKSKYFTWTHFDFVARFPHYGQGEPGWVVDHVIVRSAAIRADDTIDEAFAALVLELENIQLLTSQQNSYKRSNADARCKARALELRAQGVEGADLFHQLNIEFWAEGIDAQNIEPVQIGGAV